MVRLVLAALWRRPLALASCARSAVAFVPRGWWRRFPPDPRPPAEYLAFRVRSAYGNGDVSVVAERDLAGWLRWCAEMRRCSR